MFYKILKERHYPSLCGITPMGWHFFIFLKKYVFKIITHKSHKTETKLK
jgi:hypothetical protein